AMSNSSPGSHTIALMPNAATPSGPFSCCQRPNSVAFTSWVVRSTAGIVTPSRAGSQLGAANDDSSAHRQPLDAQLADAGHRPPAEHLLERMPAPEPLDARPQEPAGAIPPRSRQHAGGRQPDPRPRPPGRIPA